MEDNAPYLQEEINYQIEIRITINNPFKTIIVFEKSEHISERLVFSETTEISRGSFQTKSGIAGAVNLLENLMLQQQQHCYYLNDNVLLADNVFDGVMNKLRLFQKAQSLHYKGTDERDVGKKVNFFRKLRFQLVNYGKKLFNVFQK